MEKQKTVIDNEMFVIATASLQQEVEAELNQPDPDKEVREELEKDEKQE